MAIGGGTYTNHNKVIPGVYANFKDIISNYFNESTGHVAWIIPTTNQDIKNNIITVTRYNYKENTYYPYPKKHAEYIRDLVQNAEVVYIIPILVTEGKEDAKSTKAIIPGENNTVLYTAETFGITFNDITFKIFGETPCTLSLSKDSFETTIELKEDDKLPEVLVLETSEISYQFNIEESIKESTLKQLIDSNKIKEDTDYASKNGTNGVYDTETLKERILKNPIASLLHTDYYGDGFVLDTICTTFHDIVQNSPTRFLIVANRDFKVENKQNLEWFVQPHILDSSPFIAGLLSNTSVGNSLAGISYDGCIDYKDWAVSNYTEQEKLLKEGRICFYSISTEPPKILQDVTIAKRIEKVNFNLTTTQITRLKGHLYEYIVSVFQNYIHGKSNNPSYRDMMKSLIYTRLMELVSMNAINAVNDEDIFVTASKEQKNAIDVSVKVYPSVGIDFIYITFEVN